MRLGSVLTVATGTSLVALTVVAATIFAIQDTGVGLGPEVLIVLVVWALVALALVVPQIAMLRLVLGRLADLRASGLAAACLILGATSGLLAWLLTPSSLSQDAILRSCLVGIANSMGNAAAIFFARRVPAGVHATIVDGARSSRWLIAYFAIWVATWSFGTRNVRTAEAAHWRAEAPVVYWGSQSPHVFESSRPLGGQHRYRDSTITLSGGLSVSPFVVLVDFDVTGRNAGFEGRALYIWFLGYTHRVLGPVLSIWN